MALAVGSRLGHYDVTALIGEGGMGQVYQATDTKLNRQVALKILPEAFATDPDRLARFQREAQVLASLNHPGIAAIYGLEEAGGTRALVLELVEGPTLADRISKGPIPLDEALPIAKQIAEALEAAHEAGVIHRDLKPANIKVKDDGTVKVLDFGLAKALDTTPEGDPSQSPTLTAAATQMGVIMGTAAYMSPEQARGKTVDKRADIWSFGCVLFEMLSGRRPFEGRDVSETLGAVLRLDPDWEALPGDTPPRMRTLLRRCLEKESKQRVHDVADVRLAMEGAFETTVSAVVEPNVALRLQVWQRPIPLAVLAVALVVITGLAVWSLTARTPNESPAVSRFTINTSPEAPVVTNYGWRAVTVSPDGSRIAYTSNAGGTRRIYVRPVDELEATVLRGTEDNATAPFFSPDGESIGFTGGVDGRTLKRVSAFGGPPVTIATFDAQPHGMEWTSNDTILFTLPAGGLLQIPVVGGEIEQLTTVDEEADEQEHERSTLLPDGDTVLFTIVSTSEEPRLARLSLRSREVTRLPITGSDPIYSPTGHIVYVVSDGTVRAVGFDLDRLELTTTNPTPVLENVNSGFGGTTSNFGLAANGSLVYLTGDPQAASLTLVWVDREGHEEEVPIQTGSYVYPRISPDGSRVVLDDRNAGWDTWIWDFTLETRTHLTVGERGGNHSTWTSDGERIAYYNRSGDIDWKAANNAVAVQDDSPSPPAIQEAPASIRIFSRPPAQNWCSKNEATRRPATTSA